jgi:ribosome-associated translation inhibitor RaiA
MQVPLQISFHNLAPSEPLSEWIRHKIAKIEEHQPRLVGCRVSLEEPNHHHRRGKGRHFRVCVELFVPGKTLIASREAPAIVSHEDAYLAIAKTFDAALRQLDASTRRLDGHVKPHRPAKQRDRPWIRS